jgi:hypothetical protein
MDKSKALKIELDKIGKKYEALKKPLTEKALRNKKWTDEDKDAYFKINEECLDAEDKAKEDTGLDYYLLSEGESLSIEELTVVE